MTPARWWPEYVETLQRAAAAVSFDDPTHAYTVAGRRQPSVTQVLRRFFPDDFAHVPADVLERKRQIGTAAHLATHYHDRGQLDEATVDPAIAGYLASYRRFLEEHDVVIIATELRLTHPHRDYCGTIDKLYTVGRQEALHVLDLATGNPASSRKHLQTGGYAELVRACVDTAIGRPVPIRRAALWLDADGGRPTLTPYLNRHDWRKFAALRDALAVLNEEQPHAAAA